MPVTVVVTAAALVATTGAAAVVGARTGWFTPKSSEQDTSEWLDTGASDFPGVVDSLAPGYVIYPDGVTKKDAADWIVRSESGSGALVQEVGVVRGYETFARCSWVRVWQDSGRDDPVRTRAVEVLDQSAGWPASVSTDGGGVVEALRTLASDARADDPVGVDREADILCPTELLGR